MDLKVRSKSGLPQYKVLKAHRDRRVKLDRKDSKATPEKPVRRARLAHKDHKVRLAHKDHRVKLVRRGHRVKLDHRDLLVIHQ
jgi:hypothetical protein